MLDAVLQHGSRRLGIIQASDGDADVGPLDQVVGQWGAAGCAELTLDQAGRAERSRLTPRPAQGGFPDPRECRDRPPGSLLAHAAVTNTHMVGCAAELIAHAAALTPAGEAHVIPTSHVDLVSRPLSPDHSAHRGLAERNADVWRALAAAWPGAQPAHLIGIEGRCLSDCLGFFGPAIPAPLFRELAACPQVLTASLPGRQKLHRGSGPPSTVDRRLPAS